MRRTTTHDSVRPDGLTGRLVVTALGRDLRTELDGTPVELDTFRLDAGIDYRSGRTITSIDAEPPADGLDALVGARAASGFRARVDEVFPGERERGTVRYQLLDDLPTAVLVSGNAMHAELDLPSDHNRLLLQADQCAGWATDATILTQFRDTGSTPRVTGPAAPPLLDDDPSAWHDVGMLGPHDMRRWRRIDVWAEHDGVHVDGFFRDSHVLGDGTETVLHEYGLDALIDPGSMTFVSCEARLGVLPWTECPGSMASAGRVVGGPVDGLRRWVRTELTGTSTCTHLNDTLRSLEDVPALLTALDQ